MHNIQHMRAQNLRLYPANPVLLRCLVALEQQSHASARLRQYVSSSLQVRLLLPALAWHEGFRACAGAALGMLFPCCGGAGRTRPRFLPLLQAHTAGRVLLAAWFRHGRGRSFCAGGGCLFRRCCCCDALPAQARPSPQLLALAVELEASRAAAATLGGVRALFERAAAAAAGALSSAGAAAAGGGGGGGSEALGLSSELWLMYMK